MPLGWMSLRLSSRQFVMILRCSSSQSVSELVHRIGLSKALDEGQYKPAKADEEDHLGDGRSPPAWMWKSELPPGLKAEIVNLGLGLKRYRKAKFIKKSRA